MFRMTPYEFQAVYGMPADPADWIGFMLRGEHHPDDDPAFQAWLKQHGSNRQNQERAVRRALAERMLKEPLVFAELPGRRDWHPGSFKDEHAARRIPPVLLVVPEGFDLPYGFYPISHKQAIATHGEDFVTKQIGRSLDDLMKPIETYKHEAWPEYMEDLRVPLGGKLKGVKSVPLSVMRDWQARQLQRITDARKYGSSGSGLLESRKYLTLPEAIEFLESRGMELGRMPKPAKAMPERPILDDAPPVTQKAIDTPIPAPKKAAKRKPKTVKPKAKGIVRQPARTPKPRPKRRKSGGYSQQELDDILGI